MTEFEPATARVLFGTPSWRELRGTLALALVFSLYFYALYAATSFLTDRHGFRVEILFPLELSIPFVPSAAIVYLSLTLVMSLAPFVFRTRDELMPLFRTLMTETTVAALLFVLLPVPIRFDHAPPDGATGAIFRIADAVNLDHNNFPSLHVAFACTTAWAFATRCRSRLGRVALGLWATAVALSTLLTHQHHVIDVIGGVALAAAAMRFVYRRRVGGDRSRDGG